MDQYRHTKQLHTVVQRDPYSRTNRSVQSRLPDYIVHIASCIVSTTCHTFSAGHTTKFKVIC